MPRGRPLEGAPGWRVIERPRRHRWRAGYVILPLAACAGIFLALALLHSDWPGWPKAERSEASGPRVLQAPEPKPLEARGSVLSKAREAELLDAAKAQILESLRSRQAHPASDPSPIRVFIHHTVGDADAARAARLGAFLESRGFTVAGIRSVDFQIDRPSVRYYFDRDRAGSRHLIDALEDFATPAPQQAPDQPTDFTRFSPKPRQGDVEIWLASRPNGWTRSAQADPDPPS